MTPGILDGIEHTLDVRNEHPLTLDDEPLHRPRRELGRRGHRHEVILAGGPEMAPRPPHGSRRPGGAVAPLERRHAQCFLTGGPEMAPRPPIRLGSPRRSRGAPRNADMLSSTGSRTAARRSPR